MGTPPSSRAPDEESPSSSSDVEMERPPQADEMSTLASPARRERLIAIFDG
jgi:hypothetical protein